MTDSEETVFLLWIGKPVDHVEPDLIGIYKTRDAANEAGGKYDRGWAQVEEWKVE